MTQLAVDEQANGQLDEAEIVGGLLVPADEQAPEAVELGVTGFDHPVPCRIAVEVARCDGSLYHDSIKQVRQLLHVGAVGLGEDVGSARGRWTWG